MATQVMRSNKKNEVLKLPLGYLAFICLILWPQLCAGKFTQCPKMCKCNTVSEQSTLKEKIFKSVVCSGVLKDLKQLHLPQKTLMLDLSDTSLQSIPWYFFIDHGMVELEELDLSSNNLSIINHETFIGLNKLKYLDLSYNKITVFDPGCLIYNDQLTHVYLRGTDIPIPTDGSLFVSRTLKFLDISDCGIRELPSLIFSELPYLVVLNISRNPIEQVDVRILENLTWLWNLDITQTNIKCDRHLEPLAEWGKTFSVSITGYPCLNSLQDEAKFWSRPRQPTTVDGSEWTVSGFIEDDESSINEDDMEERKSDSESGESEVSDEGGMSEPSDFNKSEPTNETDIDWAKFLPEAHWAIWLACGFTLGVGITCAGIIIIHAYHKRHEEQPNELVMASDEFQLVHAPSCEPPIIQDDLPSYSSLFSVRYQKVLPTGPSLNNLRR